MDTPVSEQGSSLETMMKRGALVCVVAAGGVAVGLAVWALATRGGNAAPLPRRSLRRSAR